MKLEKIINREVKREVSKYEVQEALKNIENGKKAGPRGVPVELVKHAADRINN